MPTPRRKRATAPDLLGIPAFLRRSKPTKSASDLLLDDLGLDEGASAQPDPRLRPDKTPPVVLDGVEFWRVYYVDGSMPKGHPGFGRYSAKRPPFSGYSHALVIGSPPRITLLCPDTLVANQLSNHKPGELVTREQLTERRVRELGSKLVRTWGRLASLGVQADYDVAALVLTRMGIKVPTDLRPTRGQGDEDREPRGKPAADSLIRPIGRETKRGRVAEFFLGEPKSVREAMARFSMTRSAVLTHLHGLHSQCGVGYSLTGDAAEVLLPPDADEAALFAVKEHDVRVTKFSGDGSHVPVPEKGKRRLIYDALVGDRFVSLEELASTVGCSTASVRSHLNDLKRKNGVAYESGPGGYRLAAGPTDEEEDYL